MDAWTPAKVVEVVEDQPSTLPTQRLTLTRFVVGRIIASLRIVHRLFEQLTMITKSLDPVFHSEPVLASAWFADGSDLLIDDCCVSRREFHHQFDFERTVIKIDSTALGICPHQVRPPAFTHEGQSLVYGGAPTLDFSLTTHLLGTLTFGMFLATSGEQHQKADTSDACAAIHGGCYSRFLVRHAS